MSDLSTAAAEAVLFEERPTRSGHRIGIATLNAGKSLNALTLPMIRRLDPQLQQWAVDAGIACVVLRGAGEKAFCAGGDVRLLRDAALAGKGQPHNPVAQAFFSEEYRLDYRIHRYPKPLLVWGSGIVMGGGLGLMAGASHRVVTETSRIAMPEITIGLFPDVGGSYFLSRMPGRLGLFLGLTGAALNGADALAVGLADHFLQSADRDAVLAALGEADWHDDAEYDRAALTRCLNGFAEHAKATQPESNVTKHHDAIEHLASGDTLAAVVAQITSYSGDDAWLHKAAAGLRAGSPTSAGLVWQLQQRAKDMSLADVFRLELVVALQCVAHPDLPEGVRALLIDKDNQPHWTPTKLAALTPQWIDAHFAIPWPAGEAHPLADLH